jgi:hypothetical protein
MRLSKIISSAFCPLFLVVLAFAQSPNAKMSGIVVDTSSGVIVGADVLAANDVTGLKYSTRTNREGIYVLPNLPPGPYRLQVAKFGFKTLIKPDIVLNVQDALSINFTLPVGAVSESVTVEGGTSIVNTESAAVGTVVNRQFVENIPLNGRSFQSLITLTPGVVTVPAGTSNTGGQFSVNGQRASSNTFTVDGVSANFGASPGNAGGSQTGGDLPGLTAFGTTQALVSVDALEEFKVQTSSYSAEYGRQPGGQISIVTRSGTNQLHGSAFEYLRNDVFDANDWFANRAGQAKPKERQNDFGGTLGGPVLIPGIYDGHDRTFFFFSYEGLRLRQPNFNLTNVPGLALRQKAPAALQPLLNAFPLPNGRDLGNGLAEFAAGYSDPSSLNATSIRLDHTVNDKLTLFLRYNKAPSESTARRAGSALSSVTSNRLSTQTITLGATGLLTPRISNEFRINYSGNGAFIRSTLDGFGGAVPPPRSLLIPAQFDSGAALGQVTLRIPGFTSISAPLIRLLDNGVTSQRQFNLVDNLSCNVGSHRLKFGVDYRRLSPTIVLNSYGLLTTFSSLSQVLNGTAATGSLLTNIPSKAVVLNFSAYADDTWSISRRMTIDVGLRWDVNPAPSEATGQPPIALTQVTHLATTQLAPIGAKQWETTYHNFAPRLGAAYRLSQSPARETVLRGGFGLFYDTGNDSGTGFVNQFPYTSSRIAPIAYPLTPAEVTPSVPPIRSGLAPPYPEFIANAPHLTLPYTLQWNLALEQALGSKQAITASYVGAAGRNLLQATQLNLSTINPKFTLLDLVRNGANSDYDALQMQFQRRMSKGLQALVSYTWSHALDDDSAASTFRAAQRGNAAFDVRHLLSAAATYDIPAPSTNGIMQSVLANWSIDTIIRAQSALPVDLTGAIVTNPGDGSAVFVRPNLNPGVPLYLDDPKAPGGRKINPAAFLPAASGQSGTFGRNQVRGLRAWQIDSAFRKQWNLTEKLKLQFRAEGFNIFNHPNFGTIQTSLTAANFGEATSMLGRQLGGLNPLYQLGGPRSFQFTLKLIL